MRNRRRSKSHSGVEAVVVKDLNHQARIIHLQFLGHFVRRYDSIGGKPDFEVYVTFDR